VAHAGEQRHPSRVIEYRRIADAQRLGGLETRREAVEAGLRRLVRIQRREGIPAHRHQPRRKGDPDAMRRDGFWSRPRVLFATELHLAAEAEVRIPARPRGEEPGFTTSGAAGAAPGLWQHWCQALELPMQIRCTAHALMQMLALTTRHRLARVDIAPWRRGAPAGPLRGCPTPSAGGWSFGQSRSCPSVRLTGCNNGPSLNLG
jgi:hypothetical protein